LLQYGTSLDFFLSSGFLTFSRYEEEVKNGRRYGYDEELEAYLEEYVTQCDRKIVSAQKRLEESEKEKVNINAPA
jgi:hypothetical protein